jgi:hypothetical protein
MQRASETPLAARARGGNRVMVQVCKVVPQGGQLSAAKEARFTVSRSDNIQLT